MALPEIDLAGLPDKQAPESGGIDLSGLPDQSQEGEEKPELSVGRLGGTVVEGVKDTGRWMGQSTKSIQGQVRRSNDTWYQHMQDSLREGMTQSEQVRVDLLYNDMIEEGIDEAQANKDSYLQIRKELGATERDLQFASGYFPVDRPAQTPIEIASDFYIDAFQTDPDYMHSSGLIEDAVRGLSGSAVSMGITAIAPPLGVLQTGMMMQGASYESMVENEVDPARAFGLSAKVGIINTPLEAISNMFQLKVITQGGPTWFKFIKNLALTALGEGATEFVQQYPDEIGLYIAMNPELSRDELLDGIQEKLPEITANAAYAGLVGAVSGGGMMIGGRGAVNTVEMLDKFVTKKQKEINVQKMQEAVELAGKSERNELSTEEQAKWDSYPSNIKETALFQTPIENENRTKVIEGLVKSGKFDNEQIDLNIKLWDSLAKSYADKYNKPPEDFYNQWLTDFQNVSFKEFVKTQGIKEAEFQGVITEQPWGKTKEEYTASIKEEGVTEVAAEELEPAIQIGEDVYTAEKGQAIEDIVIPEGVVREDGQAGYMVEGVFQVDKPKVTGPSVSHKAIVQKAIVEGMPVPDEVIAQYPELERPTGPETLAVETGYPSPEEFEDIASVQEKDFEVDTKDGETVLAPITTETKLAAVREKYGTRKKAPKEIIDRDYAKDKLIKDLSVDQAKIEKIDNLIIDSQATPDEKLKLRNELAALLTDTSEQKNELLGLLGDPVLADYGVTSERDFKRAIKQMEEAGIDYTLVVADIGNMKGINDKYDDDHERANDDLKAAVGEIWAKSVQEFGGFVERHGGDELREAWPGYTTEEVHEIHEVIDELLWERLRELEIDDIMHSRQNLPTGAGYINYGVVEGKKGAFREQSRIADERQKEMKTDFQLTISQEYGYTWDTEADKYVRSSIQQEKRPIRERRSDGNSRVSNKVLRSQNPQIRAKYKEAIAEDAESIQEARLDAEFQVVDRKPKGAVTFDPETMQGVISAFETADISTPIHETGHILLKIMHTMGDSDYLSAAEFSGVDQKRMQEGYDAWTTNEKENFAKAFEAYMFEGVSPTHGMQEVFSRFRDFLLRTYMSIRDLDVVLDENIRKVFDRWVATDIERQNDPIKEVKDWVKVKNPEAAIPLDELKSIEEIHRQAIDTVTESRKERMDKERKTEYRRLKKEAATLVDDNPLYEVLADIKEIGGLDYNSVEYYYDKDMMNDILARMPGLIVRSGGLNAETFANGYGWDTVDDMIQAIKNAPTKENAQEEIYLDLIDDYERGLEASEADIYEDVLTEEIKMFHKLMRRKLKPSKLIHEIANEFKVPLSPGEIKQLKADIKQYEKEVLALTRKKEKVKTDKRVEALNDKIKKSSGEKRAKAISERKKLREELLAKSRTEKKEIRKQYTEKTLEKIIALKQKQKVAVQKIREANKLSKERAKIKNRMKKRWKQKTMLEEFKAQVQNLVSQYYSFSLQSVGPPKENFMEFLDRRELDNGDPADPLRIMAQQLNQLKEEGKGPPSMKELRILNDLVEGISFLNKEAIEQNRIENKMSVINQANDMAENIRKIYKKPVIKPGPKDILVSENRTKLEKMELTRDKLLAELTKVEFTCDGLDGWDKYNRPVWEKIYEPLNDANNKELEIGERVQKEMADAFAPFRKDGNWAGKRHEIEGIGRSLTKEQMIMVALNSGNEQNRNALKNGNMFRTDEKVNAVIDELSEAEMDLVVKLWDIIDSLYPELNDVHKQLLGVELPKVEGEYFPLSFDAKLSKKAESYKQYDDAMRLFAAAYHIRNVGAGHRKARMGKDYKELPVRLDFNVIFQHIHKTIHDISHQVPVREVRKLIKQPVFRSAVEDVSNEAVYNQFNSWLDDIAQPENRNLTSYESILLRIRKGATVVALGLKASVGAKQFGSFTQTIHEVGEYESLKALSQFIKHPKDMAEQIASKSIEMRNRDKSMDREMQEFFSKFDPIKKYAHMKDMFFWHIKTIDKLASYPTWMAQYNKSMKEHKGKLVGTDLEKRAISDADKTVRKTQPISWSKDLSKVQRRQGLMRLATMFFTFFSVYHNQMAQLHKRYGIFGGIEDVAVNVKIGKMFRGYWWLTVAPALIGAAISKRELPEDPWTAMGDMASYYFGQFPILRDVAGAIITGRDYAFSPAVRAGETLGWMGLATKKSIGAGVDGDYLVAKKELKKAAKSAFEAAGYWYGWPTGQILMTMDGIMDLMSGQTNDISRLLFREKK